jgi:hypothetical protein
MFTVGNRPMMYGYGQSNVLQVKNELGRVCQTVTPSRAHPTSFHT